MTISLRARIGITFTLGFRAPGLLYSIENAHFPCGLFIQFADQFLHQLVVPATVNISPHGSDEVLRVLGGQVGHARSSTVARFAMTLGALFDPFANACKWIGVERFMFFSRLLRARFVNGGQTGVVRRDRKQCFVAQKTADVLHGRDFTFTVLVFPQHPINVNGPLACQVWLVLFMFDFSHIGVQASEIISCCQQYPLIPGSKQPGNDVPGHIS